MKEIISLHVGQAGIQMGNSCWELFALDNSISKEGKASEKDEVYANEHMLFQENSSGTYNARAVFIDLEPTVIDEAKKMPHSKLYRPSNMIAGKEDAANNYSRGRYISREIVDEALDHIRKEVEKCNSFEGFFLYHSVNGGTGSGLGSTLMERLSVDYGKKYKTSFTHYPSPNISSGVVEPYNAVLSTHCLLEHTDSTILFDNEALYSLFSRKLKVENPNYLDINKLVARSASSLVAGFGKGGIPGQ